MKLNKTHNFGGRQIGEITVLVLITALLCTILIPSISMCIGNAGSKRCRTAMTNIISTLEKELNSQKNSEKWTKLLSQKKSQLILNEIIPLMPEDRRDFDASDYYFTADGNVMRIVCKKHQKIDDIEFTLPESYAAAVTAAHTVDAAADTILVKGIRNYAVGTALDVKNASKMSFSEGDDINGFFPELTVTLVSAAGAATDLTDSSEYTVTTDGFDMSVPGTKTVTVNYTAKDSVWANNLSADFNFEVLEKSECPPLTARFSSAKCSVEAWNWSDFVKAAEESDASLKSFGAALIYFENKYYYYPDGFSIDLSSDVSSPLNAASDRSAPASLAACTEISGETVSSADDEDIEDGTLLLSDNKLYVYKGKTRLHEGEWIRMYTSFTSSALPTPEPDDEDYDIDEYSYSDYDE